VLDSMCVTLTMRSQSSRLDILPDNLRYQIRQCTLKCPDYYMIARSLFYTKGFTDAEALANKLVGVLDYSRRILSENRQNEFGLRIMLTVVNWT